MRFQYGDEGRTLESAVHQAIGAGSMCWTPIPSGVFDDQLARAAGAALVNEVRDIFRSELAKLRDTHGVASEWNAAIEAALDVVDGRGVQ